MDNPQPGAAETAAELQKGLAAASSADWEDGGYTQTPVQPARSSASSEVIDSTVSAAPAPTGAPAPAEAVPGAQVEQDASFKHFKELLALSPDKRIKRFQAVLTTLAAANPKSFGPALAVAGKGGFFSTIGRSSQMRDSLSQPSFDTPEAWRKALQEGLAHLLFLPDVNLKFPVGDKTTPQDRKFVADRVLNAFFDPNFVIKETGLWASINEMRNGSKTTAKTPDTSDAVVIDNLSVHEHIERKVLHNDSAAEMRVRLRLPGKRMDEKYTMFLGRMVRLFGSREITPEVIVQLKEGWKNTLGEEVAARIAAEPNETIKDQWRERQNPINPDGIALQVDSFVDSFVAEVREQDGKTAAPATEVAAPAEATAKEKAPGRAARFLDKLRGIWANSNGTGFYDNVKKGWNKGVERVFGTKDQAESQPQNPESSPIFEKAPTLSGIEEHRSRVLHNILSTDVLGKALGLDAIDTEESRSLWRAIQESVFKNNDLASAMQALKDALIALAKTMPEFRAAADLSPQIIVHIDMLVKRYKSHHKSTPAREMTREQREQKIDDLDEAVEKAKAAVENAQELVTTASEVDGGDTLLATYQKQLGEAQKALQEAQNQVETQGGLVKVSEINILEINTLTIKQDAFGKDQVVINYTVEGSDKPKRLTLFLEKLTAALADADVQPDGSGVLTYYQNRLSAGESIDEAELEEIIKLTLSADQMKELATFVETQNTAMSEAQWFFDRLAKTHIKKETSIWLKKAKEAKVAGKELPPEDQEKVQAAKDFQVLLATISTFEDAGEGITDEHAAELKRLMAILELGNNQQQTTEIRSNLEIERMFAAKASKAVEQSTLPRPMKEKILRFLNNDITQFVGGMTLSEIASKLGDGIPGLRFMIGLSLAGITHFAQTGEVVTRAGLANSRDWAQKRASEGGRAKQVFSGIAVASQGLLKGFTWFTEVKDQYFSPRSRVLKNVALGFGFMGMADGISGAVTGHDVSTNLGTIAHAGADAVSDIGHNLGNSISDAVGGQPGSGVGEPEVAGQPINPQDLVETPPPNSFYTQRAEDIEVNKFGTRSFTTVTQVPSLSQDHQPLSGASVPANEGSSIPASSAGSGTALPQGNAPEGPHGGVDNAPASAEPAPTTAGSAVEQPVASEPSAEVTTFSHEATSGQGLQAIAHDAVAGLDIPDGLDASAVEKSVAEVIEKINTGVIEQHHIVYGTGPQAGEPIPSNIVQTGNPTEVSYDPDTDVITVTAHHDQLEASRGDGTQITGSMDIKINPDGTTTIDESSLSVSEPAKVAPPVETAPAAEQAPAAAPAAQEAATSAPAAEQPVASTTPAATETTPEATVAESSQSEAPIASHIVKDQPMSAATRELLQSSDLPDALKTPQVAEALRDAADEAFSAVIETHDINYADQAAADAAGKLLGLPDGELKAGGLIDSRFVHNGDAVRIVSFDPETGVATVEYDAQWTAENRGDGKVLAATAQVQINQDGTARFIPDSVEVSNAQQEAVVAPVESAGDAAQTAAETAATEGTVSAEQQLQTQLESVLSQIDSDHPQELGKFMQHALDGLEGAEVSMEDRLQLLTPENVEMVDRVLSNVIADVDRNGLNIDLVSDSELANKGFSPARQELVRICKIAQTQTQQQKY